MPDHVKGNMLSVGFGPNSSSSLLPPHQSVLRQCVEVFHLHQLSFLAGGAGRQTDSRALASSPPRVRKLDNFFAFEVESSGRAREQLVTRTVLQRWRHTRFRALFAITQPFPRHPFPLPGRNGRRGERQLPCSPPPPRIPSPLPSLSGGGRECEAWQKGSNPL